MKQTAFFAVSSEKKYLAWMTYAKALAKEHSILSTISDHVDRREDIPIELDVALDQARQALKVASNVLKSLGEISSDSYDNEAFCQFQGCTNRSEDPHNCLVNFCSVHKGEQK